jgi:aspartyl-tRNA(Asn)/glutamyl-tRNA(Gln) amidotransferase subunit C
MKITEKDVLYVADLANLELTEEERPRMVRDLNSILGHIDQLNQLDTKDVPPMTHVSAKLVESSGEAVTSDTYSYASRTDERRPSLPREEALKNAPQGDGIFFKVPKVIER